MRVTELAVSTEKSTVSSGSVVVLARTRALPQAGRGGFAGRALRLRTPERRVWRVRRRGEQRIIEFRGGLAGAASPLVSQV